MFWFSLCFGDITERGCRKTSTQCYSQLSGLLFVNEMTLAITLSVLQRDGGYYQSKMACAGKARNILKAEKMGETLERDMWNENI